MARILQVCNTDFYLSKFLAPLVRGLVAAGHEVECVCEGAARIKPELLGPAVRVHDFPFPRENSPTQFARAIVRMRRLLREGRFDLVNGHNRNASIVARVAAWTERVPVNLYTAHGFYFHDDQSKLAHSATLALEVLLARITDYTLSQSTEDVQLMTRRRFIAPALISIIGNGIDTHRFRPRPEERLALEQVLGLKADRFRIAATGRLVEGKGFGDLLEAFARLRRDVPSAELLLIGGNIEQDIFPYQRQFLARIRELGVEDQVVVTGMTNRVEDYLTTADVFVLPSYREGLPRSVLEAMSSELAVAATDIRGCREAVTPETGCLFPPHGIDELERVLRRLHAEPAMRATLGKAARQRVLAHFDERDYVARQVEAMNRLVAPLGR